MSSGLGSGVVTTVNSLIFYQLFAGIRSGSAWGGIGAVGDVGQNTSRQADRQIGGLGPPCSITY